MSTREGHRAPCMQTRSSGSPSCRGLLVRTPDTPHEPALYLAYRALDWPSTPSAFLSHLPTSPVKPTSSMHDQHSNEGFFPLCSRMPRPPCFCLAVPSVPTRDYMAGFLRPREALALLLTLCMASSPRCLASPCPRPLQHLPNKRQPVPRSRLASRPPSLQ